MKTQDEKPSWLQHFPIMFYTVVMGLGGLALAYERLNLIFDISGAVFEILRGAASLAYALICACYAAKLIRYPQACKAEFFHPVRVNFFAAFSIGTLLVASLWRDFAPVYDALFCVGTAFQTFITLHVVSFWIKNNVQIVHSNPAWFIPIRRQPLRPASRTRRERACVVLLCDRDIFLAGAFCGFVLPHHLSRSDAAEIYPDAFYRDRAACDGVFRLRQAHRRIRRHGEDHALRDAIFRASHPFYV